MGPPATGEAGTQAAMTALQWICTPLQALRSCGEEEEEGRVGEKGGEGERKIKCISQETVELIM